ncbi:MAG: hypothetical protein QM789_17500 [Paenirhodobacter sp.]
MVPLPGPSGGGKTKLMAADDGSVSNISALPPHRRNVSVVFQNYALFPHLTVAGNLAFGLRARGRTKADTAAPVAEVLSLVRMEQFADPSERDFISSTATPCWPGGAAGGFLRGQAPNCRSATAMRATNRPARSARWFPTFRIPAWRPISPVARAALERVAKRNPALSAHAAGVLVQAAERIRCSPGCRSSSRTTFLPAPSRQFMPAP